MSLLEIELRNTMHTLNCKLTELNTTLGSFQAEMDLNTTNEHLSNLQDIISDIENVKTQLDKLKFNGDNLKCEFA
jgi:hypothetical protein